MEKSFRTFDLEDWWFFGNSKIGFLLWFWTKKNAEERLIWKKKTCHPEGISFLTYTFHTFFSGNISLLLTLKFLFQSCFGSRFSSINLILWKKRPLCTFVYTFPNTSFSGDKYIWKLSVFQAKPYNKPIWREVARHFYSLPLYIQNNLNCK